MRRLTCDQSVQPISQIAVTSDDNTEYIKIVDNTTLIQVGAGSGGNGSLVDYRMGFTQADLVGDLIPVPHNLLASDGVVSIILVNNDMEQVEPSNVIFINENIAHVSLEGYTPIPETWYIRAL